MTLILFSIRHVASATVLVLTGLLFTFLVKLVKQRRKMKGLPGPPYHPIFGHLLVAAKMAAALPPDVHPHHYWYWLRKEYNLGDFYYFDVWPMGPPTLIICNAEIADQITVKNSLDKHPMVKAFLKQHLGVNNIAAANGSIWRKARTIHNPGFAVSHLMTVISTIIEDVMTFHDVLDGHAKSEKVIHLEAVAMKLSFDVIGRLVLDVDLGSQKASNILVDAFRKQMHYMNSANTWSSPLEGVNPVRQYAMSKNSAIIDKFIGDEIDGRFGSKLEETNGITKRRKAMLDVALDTYNSEIRGLKQGSSATMNPEFRQSAIDQIRTFVFAGHDTVSTLISMIFYFLSKSPEARAKACKELDDVFGPDLKVTGDKVREDPHVLNRLPYNHAVLKETLRLFPPANTVRIGSPNVFITDPETNEQYPTHDWCVWPDAYVLGRDERYFPEPESFMPERFLPDSPFPETPVGAWRPFERGPRNCIGSEFGTLEVKVVMALTLRDFDFEPAYEKDAVTVNGDPCYQQLMVSAKPKNNTPGRMIRIQRNVSNSKES